MFTHVPVTVLLIGESKLRKVSTPIKVNMIPTISSFRSRDIPSRIGCDVLFELGFCDLVLLCGVFLVLVFFRLWFLDAADFEDVLFDLEVDLLLAFVVFFLAISLVSHTSLLIFLR
jgi:hypothetical protein